MAFAGILLGAVGGLLAAMVTLALGAGWIAALTVYALGGGALATLLIAAAALRAERQNMPAGYAAAGARPDC